MRLIDVDDAIEILRKAEAEMHTINGFKAVDIEAVISFLQNQFVVDAVPVVHGRWKEGYLIHKYGCSCCGTRQDMISPYCPNCGAKMDEGVQGNV